MHMNKIYENFIHWPMCPLNMYDSLNRENSNKSIFPWKKKSQIHWVPTDMNHNHTATISKMLLCNILLFSSLHSPTVLSCHQSSSPFLQRKTGSLEWSNGIGCKVNGKTQGSAIRKQIVYLYLQESKITMPQWALQLGKSMVFSVLRKSHRGGIPLSGRNRTDDQNPRINCDDKMFIQ